MYTIFDIIVISTVGLFAFMGLKKGLIEEAFKLIGLVLGVIAATKFHYLGQLLVEDVLPFTEGVLTVVGFVIIFVIVYVAVHLLAMALKRLVRSLNLAWVDRTTGFIFGTLKGMILMAIFTWCISIFPELGLDRKLKSSATSYLVLEHFRYETVRAFRLDDELDGLRIGIRKVLFLETGAAGDEAAPLPASPDGSISLDSETLSEGIINGE